jgi:hypothetical protein
MILIAARHTAPTTCTPRDKQTRFSERNKDKRKTKQNVPHSNSNLAKSMTHHNQTKELISWFLKSFAKCLAHDEILKRCVPLVPKVHTLLAYA